MSIRNIDHQAVRDLTSGQAETERRMAAAETLASTPTGDRQVIRALVQGVWDEDPRVRKASESALEEYFHTIDSDGRALLLDSLFVNMTSDPDPPQELISLLLRLVRWIRRHRTEEANLFGKVLVEAERARKGGPYPRPVRRALKRVYDQSPTDDSQSTQIIGRFNQRQALDQLRSETAPPGEVEDSLRLLGDRPLEEATIEMVLYHVLPIRISHNYQVMNRAAENLSDWMDELPQEDLFSIKNALEELLAYRRGHREALPGRIRNEAAFSEVGVDALAKEIERLRQLPQYERVVVPALEALEGVTGVRKHVDILVDVATEEDGPQGIQAIRVLASILSGLDADVEYNQTLIDDVYDEFVAETDREVRDTLQRLATDREVSDEVTRFSLRALIRSRPSDLPERLEDILAGRSPTDHVVETALEIVSQEALVAASDPIEAELEHLEDGSRAEADIVANSLESLGHDSARRALETTFRERSDTIADRARQALLKSGYHEQVRAIETRNRVLTHANQSESAESKRLEAESERRDAKREYKNQEIRLREGVFEANETLQEGLIEVLELRIESIDTLVDLYTKDREMEQIIDRASNIHDELRPYLERISLGSDVQGGIEEEIDTIEQDLTYLERLIEIDRERADKLDSKLQNLEETSRDDLSDEEADAKLKSELQKQTRSALESLRDQYRNSARRHRTQLDDLRSTFEQKRSQINNVHVSSSVAITDIDSAIDAARKQAAEIESITEQREQEWGRIQQAIKRRDKDVVEVLNQLLETARQLERTQEEIDDLTERIAELHLTQHHNTQQSYDNKELQKEVDPRARRRAQYQAENAMERASFHEHRQVYENFVRRHYESNISIVCNRQFRDEYQSTLDQIREEIETHQ